MRIRQDEQKSMYFNKLNESVNHYNERSHALLLNQSNNEIEVAKRIKKSLRD